MPKKHGDIFAVGACSLLANSLRSVSEFVETIELGAIDKIIGVAIKQAEEQFTIHADRLDMTTEGLTKRQILFVLMQFKSTKDRTEAAHDLKEFIDEHQSG